MNQPADPNPDGGRGGCRFSIGRLMLLTVLAAMLSAAAYQFQLADQGRIHLLIGAAICLAGPVVLMLLAHLAQRIGRR